MFNVYVSLFLLWFGLIIADGASYVAPRFGVFVPKKLMRVVIVGFIALQWVVTLAMPFIESMATACMNWNLHGLAGGLLVKAWDAYGPGIIIGMLLMVLAGWVIARRHRNAGPPDDVIYGQ